jgi:hypothetical protein
MQFVAAEENPNGSEVRGSVNQTESKFCGNCKHGPVLSAEDWSWILRILNGDNPRVIERWLNNQKLKHTARLKNPHFLIPYKARLIELNKKHGCRREKIEVHPCDAACFAWQPCEQLAPVTTSTPASSL